MLSRADFSALALAAQRDPALLFQECLWVQTKGLPGQPPITRLALNVAQVKVHRALMAQRRAGKPPRGICLKARQPGISTLAAGYVTATGLCQPYSGSLIIAHLDDAAVTLFKKVQFMVDRLPGPLKPSLAATRRNELVLDRIACTDGDIELRSLLQVASATGGEQWRGMTLQCVHASEFAFWPRPEEALLGILQAVPPHPQSVVLVESTANGMGNCLAGETRVLTYDGVATLRELAGRRVRLLTRGGAHRKGAPPFGGWVDAEVRSFGVQSLLKVTLTRCKVERVVYATPDHRWYTYLPHRAPRRRREVVKPTSALQVGEKIPSVWRGAPVRFASPGAKAVALSSVGVMHGIVFGDGSRERVAVNRPAEVCLFGPSVELLRWFSPMSRTRLLKRSIGGVQVLDLPRHFKDYPSLGESASYLLGWLAGYFAADGCVDTLGHPKLCSVVREHLLFAELLCQRFGIPNYGIVSQVMATGFRPGTCHALTFPVGALPPEFFLLKKHRQRAAGRQRGLANWSVKSVERTDRREEVFCAVVPHTHSFVLEGNILTGNCFQEEFDRAVAGESDFTAVFIGWFEIPEYQMPVPLDFELEPEERELKRAHHLSNEQLQWRRYTIATQCGGNLDRFNQEYPATSADAFLVSGRPAFPVKVLREMSEAAHHIPLCRCVPYHAKPDGPPHCERGVLTEEGKFVRLAKGPLAVYRRPVSGHDYTLGADPSAGIEGGDPACIQVFDRNTGEFVATWHGFENPVAFAHFVATLALWYNTAIVAPEVNNHGFTVVSELKNTIQYQRFYVWQRPDRIRNTFTNFYGWWSSYATRPILIDTFNFALTDRDLVIYDPETISEALKFQWMTQQRAEGLGFDDRVMAAMIAYRVHIEMPLLSTGLPPRVRYAEFEKGTPPEGPKLSNFNTQVWEETDAAIEQVKHGSQNLPDQYGLPEPREGEEPPDLGLDYYPDILD